MQTENLALCESSKNKIKSAMEHIDWSTVFIGLEVDDMTQLFTSKCISIFSQYIPNEIITCDDQGPPWMTATLQSVSNVDGNPMTGNRCLRSVTRFLLKSQKLNMNISPT